MASNFKYIRTVSDSLKVKGIVDIDDDEAFISYIEDGEEVRVEVNKLLEQFNGEEVVMTLATKDEMDLTK